MVVLLGGKDVVGGKAEVVPLVGRPVVGASVVVSVGASVEVPLVGRAVVGASSSISWSFSRGTVSWDSSGWSLC